MKEIVTPGEKLSDKAEPIVGGAYLKDGKIYSQYMGVLYKSSNGILVVPLEGKYVAKEGDEIIGLVIKEDNFGYVLDTKSCREPYISKRALEKSQENSPSGKTALRGKHFEKNLGERTLREPSLSLGDVVLVRVSGVNEVKDVSLEIVYKLTGGVLLDISSKKVPRVIGKHKSMLSVIEKYSASHVVVGANGFLYVKGGKPEVVTKALELITKYSPVDNLTDKIDAYLKKETAI